MNMGLSAWILFMNRGSFRYAEVLSMYFHFRMKIHTALTFSAMKLNR